jgi:hypothetical protein
MILQAFHRYLRGAGMQRRRAVKVLFVLATAFVGILGAVQPSHAAALHVFGDMHNCEALAQGATISSTNLTPEPFDAATIPGSSAFYFTNNYGQSDYIVGCQPHVPWQTNFNNANWDGYGNPFQCVELIDRYDRLRWHDNWTWGDAGSDWNTGNHPSHFQQMPQGSNNPPSAGDILIWNNSSPGHIAIITGVNIGGRNVTLLEQNFVYYGTYGWVYYTAKRQLTLSVVHADNAYWYSISGSNYTGWKQDGSTFTGNDADPVGWLH